MLRSVGIGVVWAAWSAATAAVAGDGVTPDSWAATSPRDEIRPQFRVDATGGYRGGAALCSATDPLAVSKLEI